MLLSLIADGDQFAFTELFKRYRKKVLFIAFNLLRSNDAAEDVLQNVFTKIWVNRQKATEINQFSSYLNMMVRNEVFNILRKKAYLDAFISENIEIEKFEEHKIELAEEFDEKQRKLSEAIKALTPQQKRVFDLCGLEGKKQVEAAQILGISPATVKKHMADALRNMREYLKSAANIIFYFF